MMKSNIHEIYNSYAALFYGVALEANGNQELADQAFVKTFQTLQFDEANRPLLGISTNSYLKLILANSNREHSLSNLIFKNNSVLFKRLFYRKITFQQYCKRKNVSKSEAAVLLREKILELRESIVKS